VPESLASRLPGFQASRLPGFQAVDARLHGPGLGIGLQKNAVLRARQVTQQVGIKALLVHTLSDNAHVCYWHWGFIPSEIQPIALLLPLWRKT
jgi:hypothetical protein